MGLAEMVTQDGRDKYQSESEYQILAMHKYIFKFALS